MIRLKNLVMITTLSLVLIGCSSGNKTVPDAPPAEIYAAAQQQLQAGNWKSAITQLEALDNRYPFGAYSQQVQLDLIYAYYKNDDYPLAQATIERFIRLNPTHPDIDYVLYMSGLTDMALDDNFLQRILRINRADRDPQYARQAFYAFSRLIKGYPHSQYVSDASQRMLALKNRLAGHELEVAGYYIKRSAWVAVINRVQGMLQDFPDTEATRQALPLMEQAYRHLQLDAEADKVVKLINAN